MAATAGRRSPRRWPGSTPSPRSAGGEALFGALAQDELGVEGRQRLRVEALGAADGVARLRLAALDSAPAPRGEVLVADLCGEIVAAHPVGGTRTIADPFRPTADLSALLELRAGQLAA